jgi:DNA-binding transcriptional regulator PaaX
MGLSRDNKSAIIDGVLRFIATGGFITSALVAPNSAQLFDKPLQKLLQDLDDRSRERELRRITYYMKQRGLISYGTKDYEHGLVLTSKGKDRLKKKSYTNLEIPAPEKWDDKWRLVFFDIPMELNQGRLSFIYKLKMMGFQNLQKSIWIHPFPSRPEIEAIAEHLGIRKFVTYVEISEIDAEKALRKRFSKLLTSTKM